MTDHPHFSDGLSSLINFTGLSIPSRARFVAQCVGSSIYSSLTIGLVCGQAGALLSCGPLIPFMTGSWIGYSWGCVAFWRQSRTNAITCARRYPKVLAHSLLTNFDIEVPDNVDMEQQDMKKEKASYTFARGYISLEEWILGGGVGRLSYAILAAQSCDDDVNEMKKSERQRLVDSYSCDKDDDNEE